MNSVENFIVAVVKVIGVIEVLVGIVMDADVVVRFHVVNVVEDGTTDLLKEIR